jgi:hypothetical protein
MRGYLRIREVAPPVTSCRRSLCEASIDGSLSLNTVVGGIHQGEHNNEPPQRYRLLGVGDLSKILLLLIASMMKILLDVKDSMKS